ncbi:histidine phosphatase family protein [Roseomonas chloroacetimidivorans]|jgi:broad specificity phosphatase PhoE|uniref:histidine phosphatase family protein n=1 Tax=Roseomonas chloroacetimidivorans TaxID=1766656 RepID=UPI003C7310AE
MILLRHGQSEFNLHFTATRVDPGIEDPRLTPLGHEQAEAAAEALAGEGITRIIASPYTRALQTAAPLARRLGLPVHVQSLVRERFAFACDVGTHRDALAADWPEHDFAHLDAIWWPGEEEPVDSIMSRARMFRQEMRERPDWAHTVVVCHWGFIIAMTGQSLMNGQWIRCDPCEAGPETFEWQK